MDSIFIPATEVYPDAAMVCNPKALKLRLESMIPLVVPVVPPE